MPTYRVIHKDGTPASGVKVSIKFDRGGMNGDRTDGNGYVTISGSSTSGQIYVDGSERHNGNLMSHMEFVK